MRATLLIATIILAFSGPLAVRAWSRDDLPVPVPVPKYVEVGDFDDLGLEAMREGLSQCVARLPSVGPRVVTFRINSNGGSVYEGLDFVRAVNDLRAEGIRTVCVVDNRARSMGFWFLQMACDERLAVPWAILLTHRAISEGPRYEHDQELVAINRAMALTIAARLGWRLEQYESMVADRAWVMAADEAIRVGALDGYSR